MAEGRETNPIGRAGLLIVGGLLIQLGTLFFTHPAAFLSFVGLGCTSVLLGVGLAARSLGRAE